MLGWTLAALGAALVLSTAAAAGPLTSTAASTTYNYAQVNGIKVFYRDLGFLRTKNGVCAAARYGNQPRGQSLFIAQLMEAAV